MQELKAQEYPSIYDPVFALKFPQLSWPSCWSLPGMALILSPDFLHYIIKLKRGNIMKSKTEILMYINEIKEELERGARGVVQR